MKSTPTMRNIANPRRTTLAHLKDADELTTEAVAAYEAQEAEAALPERTANPRRTVLVDSPAS
ncbi:hypothetical protein ACH4RA_07385 [Streptomyces smyrnaeus]|uniref:hypothetical protein n=1 Tax=Streptomyces TaxID=1883 RepID=UPI000C17C0AE|nr:MULTISPECIES: hypothetical protein [unclassified Streptomyces]MBQ0865332.1 hypothetical protein [Streptomyces sp. RK75]MBQ1120412.1 hypothetical protein [Streptomyces sp. B15]MBQ1162380.1 hypothetical protein [Streptomyces sp. A73]